MADVAVLVPYRGDDGGPRDKAWAYVQRWWQTRHPGWQIVQGVCPPGPWVKARAVLDALTHTDAGIVIAADADLLCEGVERAVQAVQSGEARWAMPHYMVYRLTPAATERVLAGGPLPPPTRGKPVGRRHPAQRVRMWRASDFEGIHKGAPGGGMVVLPRALYEEVPMDPRFQSWGQEDLAWSSALRMLAGRPARPANRKEDTPTYHLWHPTPPRIYPSDIVDGQVPWGRMRRETGNPLGVELRARYTAATTPEAMRALLAEIPQTCVSPAPGGSPRRG